MEQEEESGFSLGEILRAVRKRIWVILPVTLAVTVAIILAVGFLLNPMTANYRMEFSIVYPGCESMKYLDGTPMYYRDIISLESLERAKRSDGKLSGVDVESMVEKDEISLTSEENMRFTLKVKKSCFKNASTATAFMRAVANVPIEIAKEKVQSVNYLIEEEVFQTASFGDRINLLTNWKGALISQYDSWIGLYHENYTVSGRTLKNYRAEAAVAFDDQTRTELLSELSEFGYGPADQAAERLQKLREELALNNEKIEKLRAELASLLEHQGSDGSRQPTGGDSIYDAIAGLVVRNVEIGNEIEKLEASENAAAFESRLNEEYEKLQTASLEIGKVAAALYEQESRVMFETFKISSEGGVNVVLAGIGGFLLVFLLMGAIACLLERSKERGQALNAGGGKESASAGE